MSNRRFFNIDKGTRGLIAEDYGTGIMVAWDKPHKPIPKDMTPEDIGKMYAVNPNCPDRDGFDKMTELKFLDIIIPRNASTTEPIAWDAPCLGCGNRRRSCVCCPADDVQ